MSSRLFRSAFQNRTDFLPQPAREFLDSPHGVEEGKGDLSHRRRSQHDAGKGLQPPNHVHPTETPRLKPTVNQLVRGVLQREDHPPSTGQFDVAKRLWQTIVGTPTGKMPIIMTLVYDQDRRGCIDDRPSSSPRVENHPVVPTGPTNGEGRDLVVAPSRKHEVVTSARWMEPARLQYVLPHPILPSR